MAGRYNRWLRQKLADRIRSNGGYRSRNCGSAPLEWTVHYFQQLDTPERAAKLIAENYYLNMADFILCNPDFDEWFAEYSAGDRQVSRLWEYAQERLVDDLHNDDGLRMWSPETARRYGFEYKGDGAERPFDMALKNYGRSGKHVCMTSFLGVSLEGVYTDDLAEHVEGHLDPECDASPYTNVWCRKLMGIMDELDLSLTDESAAQCGAYYEADAIAGELNLNE